MSVPLLKMFFAAISATAQISLSGGSWGAGSGAAGTTPITFAVKTVLVPAGSSGKLILDATSTAGGTSTPQYTKNAGVPVGISGPAVVTFANGDSIQIRLANPNPTGNVWTITATDFDSGVIISTATITVT